MNTWKVILATLVIFLAGIVTGGVAVGFGARLKNRVLRPPEMVRPPGGFPNSPLVNNSNSREPGRALNFPQPRQPGVLSKEFLQKLHAEVSLTQGQRERIEQIIAEGQQRNKELWERITPELRREMQETQKHIREILTDEQRTRFEELMKQQRPQRRPDEPGQPNLRPQREQRRLAPPAGTPSPATEKP